MTNALRADEYILPEHNVIGLDGQPVNIEPAAASVLAGALAINEEEAKPKKKGGRPKGSKSKTSKKAKTAKAPKTPKPDDGDITPETKLDEPKRRIAAGGEGMLSRVRRMTADQWMWVAIVIAGVSLGLSLAFLTGAVKL